MKCHPKHPTLPDVSSYFKSAANPPIKKAFRNTADDIQPAWPHFEKFYSFINGGVLPETYSAEHHPPEGSAGFEAQVRLVENFTKFRWALTDLFAGKPVPNFYVHMVTLAGNILACWQNGAVPTFSPDELGHSPKANVQFAALELEPRFPLPKRLETPAEARTAEPVPA